MNRNDLKEYFARLKKGQQDAFANGAPARSGLLSESSYGDYNDPYDPKHNTNLVSLEQNAPIGGGLGRGLGTAKQNLKTALSYVYQEVVDSITDELGADVTDGTNQMAYDETVRHVSEVVKDFMFGISVPSSPYPAHGFEDDDDPIRRMGFEDYQSDTGDGTSEEYDEMVRTGNTIVK